MTSFAKIGYTYNGVNHALCTDVLRDEWGFNGIVVSDIVFYANQDGEQMVLAGNNLALIKANTTWTKFNDDGTLNVSGGGGVMNVLYEYINKGASDFNSAFETYLKDSPKAATALYNALREGAHGIIYTVVNSNVMQIPYGATVNYTQKDVSGLVAGKADQTVDLGGAELSTLPATYGNLYGTEIKYTVTEGALPTGMSIDSATGKLTGTPTSEGTYNFTVTATATGYESASVKYTIAVVADNSEIIGAINGVDKSVGNVGNSVDSAVSDSENNITTELDAVQSSVDSVKTIAILGMVFAILSLCAGGAAVVLTIINKGKKD
jgi:beta-glucosidase